MTKKELESLANLVADKVVERVVEQLRGTQKSGVPDMVDSTEAARILGISRNYLLMIKERFNYVKTGENKQSRILFNRQTLLEEYLKGA